MNTQVGCFNSKWMSKWIGLSWLVWQSAWAGFESLSIPIRRKREWMKQNHGWVERSLLSNWQNCRVRLCLCYQGSLSLHKNSLSNTFCPQQLQGHSQKVFSSSISGSTEGNSNKIISTFSEFFFQGEASPFFSYLSLILLFSFFETCQPEYTQVTKKCFTQH